MNLLLVILAASVVYLPTLPKGKCVLDEAGALSSQEYERLESRCEALGRTGAGQIAIAIVNDLRGLELATFALMLFKSWGGLGHRGRDDGAIVVLKLGDRPRGIRVTVGYGLETALNEKVIGDVLDHVVIPLMRKRYYGDCLQALMEHLIAIITAEDTQANMEQNALENRRKHASSQH
jgi:uncharacterized protein